jgi:cytochrome oxidase Cu insertion factor (SCO1/SenC/PrrC family)
MVRQRIEGRAPELALIDQSGQPLTLKDLQGKVVLLTFTYSSCTDVCPLITAAMAILQQRLTAAERDQAFFLSVTTEPEVDTPAVLHAYAKRLGADLASWAFLTGHPQAVQEVWQAFRLTPNFCAKFRGSQTDQIALQGIPALVLRGDETSSVGASRCALHRSPLCQGLARAL